MAPYYSAVCGPCYLNAAMWRGTLLEIWHLKSKAPNWGMPIGDSANWRLKSFARYLPVPAMFQWTARCRGSRISAARPGANRESDPASSWGSYAAEVSGGRRALEIRWCRQKCDYTGPIARFPVCHVLEPKVQRPELRRIWGGDFAMVRSCQLVLSLLGSASARMVRHAACSGCCPDPNVPISLWFDCADLPRPRRSP